MDHVVLLKSGHPEDHHVHVSSTDLEHACASIIIFTCVSNIVLWQELNPFVRISSERYVLFELEPKGWEVIVAFCHYKALDHSVIRVWIRNLFEYLVDEVFEVLTRNVNV